MSFPGKGSILLELTRGLWRRGGADEILADVIFRRWM
jgi:hypothetical protein